MTNTETQRKIYGYTDFATAIRWLDNNYNEFSVATKYDQKLKETFDEKYNDGYTTPYLSDCSDDEIKYLKDTFGLIFEYSEVFEKWLLIVDHFGTQWKYIACPVYSEDWWEEQKNCYAFLRENQKENIDENKKYYVHFEVVGHIYQDIEAESIDEAYEKARNSFVPEAGELENYETTIVSITAPGADKPTYFD